MPDRMIDMRSDTVTRPTTAMRRVMAEAEVGDDVFGEDPSVNRLEVYIAELLGKEAAVFVPSGTMANEIAVRIHTRPGDEMLCEQSAHVCLYEAGGPAALSGVTCRGIGGRRGILDRGDFEGMIRPSDHHFSRTRLVAIENTHNRGGGSIYPLDNIARICAWARQNGLATHLDGARLFNAAVATGVSLPQWCQEFDTVAVCFSKGLGAPVGSAIVGDTELIHEARRVRKLFGGGMRQAGVLAAAALYALEHHMNRLAEDHANAKLLAETLEATEGFLVRAGDIETNLIWVEVQPTIGSAAQIVQRLRDRRILICALGAQTIRFCTHLDVSRDDVQYCCDTIRGFGRA